MTPTRGYHHGDLRRALLDAAVEAIGESGPAALSLRDLARRAGVSHAAPAHHFGDKAGLLTALAVQGFDLLAWTLRDAGDDLLAAGVAYVDFAVRHRAHFEVMFRPELYRAHDPEVRAASDRAGGMLRDRVAGLPARDGGAGDPGRDALAAWSIVHGFATLWLAGALPPRVGDDPREAARHVISRLVE
ncbi:TetR/AcrR family transcriptional regulator [Micromonospora sp. NPDC023737]|uniref:TetR/AcrR family transcriptional regulator n=1 Tax=unclassified Micromonospora TaxID=2617518 RepID=UPI0033CBA8FC